MRIVLTVALAGLLATSSVHAASRADVISTARASVVSIAVKGKPAGFAPPFFGQSASGYEEDTVRFVGSGFVIDQVGGFIATADYVVEGAREISVTLADGRTLPARLSGKDRATGVAVLKITDTVPSQLSFCDNVPRVGDDALVIGNPYQLGVLAYSGMVAGIDVAIDSDMPKTYMVLDMVIHKGVGGGPILSPEGCVTGMAAAQYGVSGSGIANLGVAIPAERIRTISEELIRSGRVVRSYVGVSLIDSGAVGQQVIEVTPGGPVDRAGIKAGDILISYDDKPANSFAALSEYISALPPGTAIVFKVRRGQDDTTITVTTTESPPQD